MVVMRAKALAATPPTQQQQLMASAYPFSPSPKGGISLSFLIQQHQHQQSETQRAWGLYPTIIFSEQRTSVILLWWISGLVLSLEKTGKLLGISNFNQEQRFKSQETMKLNLADAGSSGAGSGGQKYNATQQGAETFQMKIANNKVGLIIGKGGETI
ncbi:hypothetical protein Zm00014a_025757 [Zea mays]|uniref:K Homology domain-containing protein n=1 Tax=Zea mays TaxID=4577 RepID=A0A3L6FV84_MAIZE|nr:hypothetical protein Zm00014a_025757 [Zea mays]